MNAASRSRCVLLSWAILAVASGASAAGREDISPISDPEKLPVGAISEQWLHVSATSAVVYWQTANRARSFVQYGPTAACEHKTAVSAISAVTHLPHWTHVHRLVGLAAGRTYHWRPVCLGTDGKTVRGEVKTFVTRKLSGEIRVPDDLPGKPYVLGRKGGTYVMTRDLTLPLGGLEIRAADVTLDMDGHTLTYNDRPSKRPADWSKRAYVSQPHDFGINVTAKGSVRVLNGRIVQGRGRSSGTQVGIGCNPVYSRGATVEMAGVEVVWSGRDVSGLFFHWGKGGNHVHHCVFADAGDAVTNRHQAISTVDGNVWGRYDHNLVKRTRQQALVGAARATHNEVYIDSVATNAFGIVGSAKAPGPVEIAHNRVIGIGQHPVGIGMFGAYKPGTSVHGNLVEVKCTRSGAEYGYTGSACFRTTWGADNLDVFANTFVGHADVYGGKVSKTRVVWVGLPKFTPKGAAAAIADARGVFRENMIAALGRNGAKAGGICVVCLNESPNLIFRGNTVVSTWGNVLLGDEYGHSGGYPKFVGNTFRRVGKQDGYRTIRHDYGSRPGTGVFLGNRYENEAAADSVRLGAKGELVMQAAVDVVVTDGKGRPLAAARVVIHDKAHTEVFDAVTPSEKAEAMLVSSEGATLAVRRPADARARGFVDSLVLEKGTVRAVLTRYVLTAAGKAARTPHTVTVTKPGHAKASRTLDADTDRTVKITLPAAPK